MDDNSRFVFIRRERERALCIDKVIGNDPTLPAEVHIYHSLYPLEQQQEKMGHYDEHPATVYKATCKIDRRSYALVRIEGYSKVHEEAVSIAESLRSIRHCNIVSFRDVFITKAFGDDCK